MFNDEILVESLKKIPGVLKSNEIPNARYLIHNGTLMIEMYDTLVYFVSLSNPISQTYEPIGFTIFINENKELIPVPANREATLQLYKYNNYYKAVPNCMGTPLLAQQDNLQDDPEYSELLKLRSGDGMKFYKLQNNSLYGTTFIPVFNGFPSMAKNDFISVKVYKDEIEGYSVVEYTIYKNKLKDNVKLYFRILNI